MKLHRNGMEEISSLRIIIPFRRVASEEISNSSVVSLKREGRNGKKRKINNDSILKNNNNCC